VVVAGGELGETKGRRGFIYEIACVGLVTRSEPPPVTQTSHNDCCRGSLHNQTTAEPPLGLAADSRSDDKAPSAPHFHPARRNPRQDQSLNVLQICIYVFLSRHNAVRVISTRNVASNSKYSPFPSLRHPSSILSSPISSFTVSSSFLILLRLFGEMSRATASVCADFVSSPSSRYTFAS
jgi:hypothetical protein